MPVLGSVTFGLDGGTRTEVPEPTANVRVPASLPWISVIAGAKSPEVARMITCWPCVPLNV